MDSFQATLFPGLPPQRLLGPIFKGHPDDQAALGAVVLIGRGVGRQWSLVAALTSELRVTPSKWGGEVHVGPKEYQNSTLRAERAWQ